MSQQSYWNKIYKQLNTPSYDGWLDKYIPLLKKSNRIVDLGCGDGSNTIFLNNQNIKNIAACDLSKEALKKVNKLCPEILTLWFDMSKGLPFYDNTIDVIIADLSLHYFKWAATIKIVKEISKILVNDGMLLARLNSVNDFNFGALAGIKIEDNYFNVNGCTKRFFNKTDICNIFNKWEIKYLSESSTIKYGKTKIVWEISVQKDGSCGLP